MSGEEVSLDDIRRSFWRYALAVAVMPNFSIKPGRTPAGCVSSDCIFVSSAISADVYKQKYGVFPRRFYIDTLKQCRDCGKSFIFFALEQRHWYEALGFWIDSDCVRCSICRVKDQRIRKAQQRYSDRVIKIPSLSEREFSTLLRDGLLLAESGLLKDDTKLRRLRNIGLKMGMTGEPLSAVSAFLEKSFVYGVRSDEKD